MAVPKRKMSRANTRIRRSTWKADLTELNTVKVAGREISDGYEVWEWNCSAHLQGLHNNICFIMKGEQSKRRK